MVEWDLCLDDCPYEEPEVVCLEDPEFPHLIISNGRTTPLEVNFTTSYSRGQDLVTAELDYVEFDCPEGYAFTNTTASTIHAICYNWTWSLQYDVASHCYPVKCGCPPWFDDNNGSSPVGTYDWSELSPPICNDPDPRPRHYKSEIEYMCPTGFVLDISQLDPNAYNETSRMKWICETAGSWSPAIQPKCVRKYSIHTKNNETLQKNHQSVSAINCREDPFKVPGNHLGRYSWVTGGNKSFTAVVNYT